MPITIEQWKQKNLEGSGFTREQLENAASIVSDMDVAAFRLNSHGYKELSDKMTAAASALRYLMTMRFESPDDNITDMMRSDWNDAMQALEELTAALGTSAARSDLAFVTGTDEKELFGNNGAELYSGMTDISNLVGTPDLSADIKDSYTFLKTYQKENSSDIYKDQPNMRLSDEEKKKTVDMLLESVQENADLNGFDLEGFSDSIIREINEMKAEAEALKQENINIINEPENIINDNADKDEIVFDPNEFGKEKEAQDFDFDGAENLGDDLFDYDDMQNELGGLVDNKDKKQEAPVDNKPKEQEAPDNNQAKEQNGAVNNKAEVMDVHEPQNQLFDYNDQEEIQVHTGDDNTEDFIPDSKTSAANDPRFAQLDNWKTLNDGLLKFLPRGQFATMIVNEQGMPMSSQAIKEEAQERFRRQLRNTEDYKNTKERIRFLTESEKVYQRNGLPLIEEFAQELAEKRQHLGELDGQIEQQLKNAGKDIFEQKDGYDPEKNAVTGVNSADTINDFVLSDQAAGKLNRQACYLSRTFKNIAEAQKDKTVKRAYEDMAVITDPLFGNFSKARMSNPYITAFSELIKTGPNYLTDDIKKQRNELGAELSGGINDLKHLAVEEIKAEYQLEENKETLPRSNADESRYLDRLHKTHTEFINCYDKLSKYKDDPEGKIAAHFHGSLEETLSSVEDYVGYIRGEKKAIENGWHSDELSVLGMVGAMEQSLRRLEKNGTEQEKQGIEEFRDKLTALKTAAYSKNVNTGKDKKEIADQVKALLDSEDSPAAQYCKKTANNCRKAFDNACTLVEKQYQRQLGNGYIEQQEINDKANNVEYLNDLLNEAKETGDFKRFANEYVRIRTDRVTRLNPHDFLAFNNFENNLMGIGIADGGYKPIIGQENYYKLFNELCRIQSEKCALYAQKLENTAEQIREGRLPVSPKYNDIKTDHKVSMALASNYLKKNDPLHLEEGVTQMNVIMKKFKQKSVNLDQLEQYSKEYYHNSVRNGMDSFSPEQRTGQIRDGVYAQDISRLTKDDSIYDSLTETVNVQNKFMSEYQKIKTEAQRYYNEMTTLKNGRANNSLQFMRMYRALEDVTKLGNDASPSQITEKLKNLNTTSNDYYDKIHSHTFAGILKNGSRRYQMSFDLAKWTTASNKLLSDKVMSNIGANQPIDRQIANSKQAKDNYLKREIDLDAKKQELTHELGNRILKNDQTLSCAAKLIAINKYIEAKQQNPRPAAYDHGRPYEVEKRHHQVGRARACV